MENAKNPPPNTALLDEQHHNTREKPGPSLHIRYPNSTDDDPSKPRSTFLFRQSYLLLLVSLYSILAIAAWTILCVQTKRPITTSTYDYIQNNNVSYLGALDRQMQSNVDWFRTVKILLAITNSLIIPLTSAVCASAAVIHVQSFGRRRQFSMQHTSTLADKGWTSPPVWLDLLTSEGRKARASYFLIFAMAFHVLGFLIGPLQQYFITEESFKYGSGTAPGFQGAADVLDLLNSPAADQLINGVAFSRLRSELASTSYNAFQPNLWQEGTPQCAGNDSTSFEVSPECNQGGTTFNNITSLLSPYTAQLPAAYQTGLITQFLPRMNSSLSYTVVPQSQFPQDCATMPNAYYVQYVYNETLLNLRVCIPNTKSGSPWQATRDRQDISEEMYMDMSFGLFDGVTGSQKLANQTFQVAVNTSLGYFALPNYNSSGIAGPLLAKDPDSYCNNTYQCVPDESYFEKRSAVPSQDYEPHQLQNRQLNNSLQTNQSIGGYGYASNSNLGPLAMLTVAMFDPGAFIATQFKISGTQPGVQDSQNSDSDIAVTPCTVPPLGLLIGTSKLMNDPCVQESSTQRGAFSAVSQWLAYFYDIGSMQNALHAGVILASQSWLNSVQGNRDVLYDLGSDSTRPKISTAGVVLISILLAIDLFLLLARAAYAGFSYSWTSSYDSLAMMRQGAARAHELGLQVGDGEAKEALMKMPGWVGDAAPNEEVGVLAIGAEAPLRKGRQYINSFGHVKDER